MSVGRGRRRAARVVVLDPLDRVLLINARDPRHRVGPDWWEIPGGGIDPGETSAEAVRRELWEEAGIDGAEIGPCVWIQTVEFTFGGWHFEQDEWVHVARCDGTTAGPRGLEALEALAFGEQRWWTIDEVVEKVPRTIPYRLAEFLPDLVSGTLPEQPLDITPSAEQVTRWRTATDATG
jgi:8-oxo-dGTP pyrophosphatase MutT (NUDIX family)